MSPASQSRGALVVAVALACAAPSSVRAEEVPLAVELEGCEGMEAEKVERLLAIDLASVASSTDLARPLGVLVECKGARVRIAIRDPLTEKGVEREIPAPPTSEPGRERVIALATSQLFIASWMELLGPRDAAAASVPPPAVRAARDRARAAIGREGPGFVVGLAGSVRGRDGAEPFATVSLGSRGGAWIDGRWELFGEARFEAGTAHRRIGEVDVRAFFLGGGATWRWTRLGPVGLDATAAAYAGWMELHGRPEGRRFVGGVAESLTGEVVLAGGPTLEAGPFEIGLDVQVGAMLPTPMGVVAGGPDISPGGLWLGAGLRLGLGFGER